MISPSREKVLDELHYATGWAVDSLFGHAFVLPIFEDGKFEAVGYFSRPELGGRTAVQSTVLID